MAMKESHDNLEPLAIGKSAYSVRNKEELQIGDGKAQRKKRPVSLGALPKDNISS